MNIFNSSYFMWSIVLIIAVPLLITLLNELTDRSRRVQGDYTDILLMLRDVVLPLMALLVVLRLIFVVDINNFPVKLINTAFWVVLMVAVFKISRKVIGVGTYHENDWRGVVPHLFLRLPPYTIMGLIVFHIVQNLWSLPIKELATTLGIGSIVIAFALQDTLSNLVSGLLLVANRPFKTGDWIHVGSIEGKIIAVNWRYTNIETWSGDLVVIPNGFIAGKSIENHSRPTRFTALRHSFNIDFHYPPSKVTGMFVDVMSSTPGVAVDPAPSVSIINVADPVMEYQIEFWIHDYGIRNEVYSNVLGRCWYALQRHGMSKLYLLNSFDETKAIDEQDDYYRFRHGWLEQIPLFADLNDDVKQRLAALSAVHPYARSEKIIGIRGREAGVYVVLTGTVMLSMKDNDGESVELEVLGIGGIFGEAGLSGRPVCRLAAIAETDSEVLVIPHDLINKVINEFPVFATEFSQIINHRRILEKSINQPEVETATSASVLKLADTAGGN